MTRAKRHYRQVFVHEDRLKDFERLHKWVEKQPTRRWRSKNLSLADAILDLSIGYLDIIEGHVETDLAQDLAMTLFQPLLAGGRRS